MSFIKRFGFQIAFCGLILGTQAAQAGQVGLSDWCVNVNGSVDSTSVTNNPSNACKGGTNAALGSVNISGFDTTLVPGNNNLGSITVTLGVGTQYVGFYSDYDVNYTLRGSFDDTGSTNGAVPANVSYELDDPTNSNIFNDFAGNTLANTNNVGTASTTPQCCDVSWAMILGGLTVQAGGSGTVIFNVTNVAPTGGFYLSQTNNDSGDTIYLQATSNIVAPVVTGTPEPSTFALGFGALGLVLAAARRKRVSA